LSLPIEHKSDPRSFTGVLRVAKRCRFLADCWTGCPHLFRGRLLRASEKPCQQPSARTKPLASASNDLQCPSSPGGGDGIRRRQHPFPLGDHFTKDKINNGGKYCGICGILENPVKCVPWIFVAAAWLGLSMRAEQKARKLRGVRRRLLPGRRAKN